MRGLLRAIGRSVVPITVRQRLFGWWPYGYHGRYADWEAASRASIGYDSPVVLERTREATSRVRNGQAAYQQDGLSMGEVPEHAYRLAAILAIIALERCGTLRVLDFGGALGGTYFFWRSLAGSTTRTSWVVVERPGHCECGRREFAAADLSFHESVEAARAQGPFDVVLCNSVLQFLEDPPAVLDQLLALAPACLVIDRTPFSASGTRELTVQRVPPSIYPASYPSWLLSEAELLACTRGRYDTWLHWQVRSSFTARATFKGFALRRTKAVP